MSQGPLCPNLSQKVQKEVSQMANRNLPRYAIRWFKCKLKPPKNKGGCWCELWTNFFYPNFMIYGLCSLLRCNQLTVAHIQGSSLYYTVVSEIIHSCIFVAYQVRIHTNGSTI